MLFCNGLGLDRAAQYSRRVPPWLWVLTEDTGKSDDKSVATSNGVCVGIQQVIVLLLKDVSTRSYTQTCFSSVSSCVGVLIRICVRICVIECVYLGRCRYRRDSWGPKRRDKGPLFTRPEPGQLGQGMSSLASSEGTWDLIKPR